MVVSPVSAQKAPTVLGEVSPTLLCAKAATMPPDTFAAVAASEAAHLLNSWAATPLLSPLIRVLVLLMEVQCTAYQATAPMPLQQQSCCAAAITLYATSQPSSDFVA